VTNPKNKILFDKFFIIGLITFFCFIPFMAAIADVEKDNNAVVSVPASDAGDVAGDEMVRKVSSSTETEPDANFNYFLTSGYAANDIANIPSVGKVTGTPELDGSLSTAKSIFIALSNDKMQLDPGEKLIVFGDMGAISVKRVDFNKRFIKNLAILRVREGMGRRYLTDVVTSYGYIPAGSPVKLYSGEKTLWDKAQVAKEPPTHPIKCYVAGGERGRDAWNQTDYIILTAGTKQGVVEGVTFQLWETTWNRNVKLNEVSRGFAKVFYAGSNYCLARIQDGSGSIANGFEAYYKP